jgi:hypothetical protein
VAATAPPFGPLDFLYVPSRDVARDLAYFSDVLGGEVVFAIDGMGTRVAAVRLSDEPPLVLLTDHLEGDRPILVYRVPDLDAALDALEARGWARERTFEIPHGPICSFTGVGGHRIAVYELTRPEVGAHFEGRRDF